MQTVTGDEQQLEFDLSQYHEIQRIRFDPLNDLTMLEIQKISVLDVQGIAHQIANYEANTTYDKANCPIFDTGSSQIFIDLPQMNNPIKLIFQLKYLVIGRVIK